MSKIILIIIITIIFMFVFNFQKHESVVSDVYIKKSLVGGKYGRGVYAKKLFKKDDIIEKAPYIEDDINVFKGVIHDYIFTKKNTNNAVVAFGYASIYNHSDNPNAIWTVTDDYVVIKAVKDIYPDDEIFVSYGSQYWNTRKLKKLN